MNLVRVLQHIGLDEGRASVYLATLELGTAKALDIATKARIKRTAVYDILEKLRERGLISAIKKGSRYFYTAVNPVMVAEIVNRQREEIKKALPEFEARYKSADAKRPTVRFFEDIEGMKTVSNETLESKEKLLRKFEVPPLSLKGREPDINFFEDYTNRRIERGIREQCLRDLRPRGDIATLPELYLRHGDEWLREVKYLGKEQRITAPMVIWDNKVIVASFIGSDHYLLVIESSGYADMMKMIFAALWKTARQAG